MRTSSTALLACSGMAVMALVGCDEPFPYCYGINETNMPSQLRIVEPALGAQRYRVGPDDLRVPRPDEVLPPPDLVGCQNIDGFDQVETIRIRSVKRENWSFGGMRVCEMLTYSGYLEPRGGGLVQSGRSRSLIIKSIGSASIQAPPIQLAAVNPIGVVSISPTVLEQDDVWYGKTPLEREILYAQQLPNDAPPVIIERVWTFDATPESADVMEQLGITTDTERATCVDYYYGYYLP